MLVLLAIVQVDALRSGIARRMLMASDVASPRMDTSPFAIMAQPLNISPHTSTEVQAQRLVDEPVMRASRATPPRIANNVPLRASRKFSMLLAMLAMLPHAAGAQAADGSSTTR